MQIVRKKYDRSPAIVNSMHVSEKEADVERCRILKVKKL